VRQRVVVPAAMQELLHQAVAAAIAQVGLLPVAALM
jgi:hypothetical protein